jgi:predicted acylesterase/phospholipase RssA
MIPAWQLKIPPLRTDPAHMVAVPKAGAGADLPQLSVAFGGGGPFGIAYGLGVAHAVEASGLSFDGVQMLGTSAGAWVASCVATGVSFGELCAVPQLRLPNPRPGLLRAIAGDVFGDARSPQVTAAAVRMPSSRRVLLSGAEHRLADIVAASSAVPALFAPVRIGRHVYVDGGVRSLVSAHHASPARRLLVVAPIAGPMFGPAGRTMELMLREEIRRWEQATGGTAHLLRPNTEISMLARHPLQLFDKGRAQAVYPLAFAQARASLALPALLAA